VQKPNDFKVDKGKQKAMINVYTMSGYESCPPTENDLSRASYLMNSSTGDIVGINVEGLSFIPKEITSDT